MTAHATIEERQRCLAAGMNDHVSKPIDPEMLFATVRRFCRQTESGGAAKSGAPAVEPVPLARLAGEDSSAEPSSGEAPAQSADELSAIDGLDTQDGLMRVAGNRKLYVKLLRQFLQQQSSTPAEIAAAVARGEISLAERLAHTLKGVAGNIGAKAVQATAGMVEKLLREKSVAAEFDAANKQAAAVLESLVSRLRVALGAPAEASALPTPALAFDPAKSREAATRLSILLSAFDPSATDFLDASRELLQPLFPGGSWADLEKRIGAYSFADAQAQVEETLKKIVSP